MLLLNLGLTLGAEAMTKDMHGPLAQTSSPATHSDHNEFGAQAPAQQDHATSNCFDPCHTGGSHFGHLSLFFAINIKSYSLEDNRVIRATNDRIAEGPFIEGLKRPPKHS